MRVTSKGQVTIPLKIREQAAIGPGSEVEFEIVGNVVQLRKVPGSRGAGKQALARLLATPYRGPSTDELMALTRGER